MAIPARTCPSYGRRGDADLKQLLIALVQDRNEVLFSHHSRPFGTNAVSDEAAVLSGFVVVRAFVTQKVMSGNLAGEMKKVLHCVGLRPVLGLSGPLADLTSRSGNTGSVPKRASGLTSAPHCSFF
jgi:hypothetical protein